MGYIERYITSQRVEKLADLMIDHERRLIRLESGTAPPRPTPRLRK
jgi:hypothetical protein